MGRDHTLSEAMAGRPQWRLSATARYLAAPLGLLFVGAHRSSPTASSLIAATGLGVLAFSDASRRHLSRTTVRQVAGAVTVALVASSVVHDNWHPLARAYLAAAAVATIVGVLWWAMPGAFAFGDVKATIVASAAAAAASWTAAAIMLAVAFVAGGALAVRAVLSDRVRRPSVVRTVPFVPGLLLGFVVGVSLW